MSAVPGSRIRIKFCGMTRVEDVQAASALGVDAVGLVFHPASARAVEPARAGVIAAAVPAFVTRVGVFVDAEPQRVHAVLAAVPLDVLQFHGDEPPDYCRAFGRPYLKALRMAPGADPGAYAARYPDAVAILVDSHDPQRHGGTGLTFDWSRLGWPRPWPLVLAGGLTPDNVARACRLVRPHAVDVSGGIESSPGIKDARRMRAFVDEVCTIG